MYQLRWPSGNSLCISSDGLVVRASASVAADFGLIPSRVKPMTLKLAFTVSLRDAQQSALKDSVKNKPVGLLVVPLKKAFNPHLGVVGRWPATPQRARYSALIALS